MKDDWTRWKWSDLAIKFEDIIYDASYDGVSGSASAEDIIQYLLANPKILEALLEEAKR